METLARKMMRSPSLSMATRMPERSVRSVSRGIYNNSHRHFSSAYHRQISIAKGSSFMDCAICQAAHQTQVTKSWRGTVTEGRVPDYTSPPIYS